MVSKLYIDRLEKNEKQKGSISFTALETSFYVLEQLLT